MVGPSRSAAPVIGILALQGDFAAHEAALHPRGVGTRRIAAVEDLCGLDGLVLPGGESSVMWKLLPGQLTSMLFGFRRSQWISKPRVTRTSSTVKTLPPPVMRPQFSGSSAKPAASQSKEAGSPPEPARSSDSAWTVNSVAPAGTAM